MQNDVVEKARNLGRPLSSFRERDMSLNEAQPSVLGHASGDTNGRSETQKVIRTISAPRTVYAQFQDAQPNGESRPELCNDHTAPDSAVCTDVINLSDACMRLDFQDTTRTQKVQFEDSRNQVTTYTPSPTACPTAARVATEKMRVKQHRTHNSAVWSIAHAADPRLTAEEEEQHGGGISRCASNLGSRAGTFNELMAICPKLGGSQRQFGGRPEGVQISDCDPQPSRCASNMSTRAGTFNEITADPIVAHPLSLGDSLLDSSAMLSTVSLGSQQPSRCPPTRRVSNMMSCAGTFEEVLDTSEFAVDNELFDGTISRRATNMLTAAGAFEELVDEDGDELGPEEHSCSSMESGEDSDGVNISLSGMVSNVGVAHDSAEEFDRSPLISLHSDIPEPQKAQEFQGGWESVMPIDPSAGTGDALLASEFLYGVLPSDVLEEVNEGTGCNPMATAEPSHDACKYKAQDNGPSTGLRAGPQGTGIWGPTPEQAVSANCIRQTRDLKFDASNSSDRLAMIREQIKSLALEEQKLLLSTLSAELSTGSEEPANSMSLATHLSIQTPHRTLKHFQFEEELEGDLSGPLVSSSLQLQKSASAAGMTVRTPRAKYNVVFAGDENAAMPSAMAAIESKQEAVARAILTPMEWSMKLAHKPAASGPGHGALSHPSSNDGLRVKLMPASSAQERTTRLEAYRP